MSAKKIPLPVAETMILFYVSVKNAERYAQAICDDPDAEPALKNNLFRQLQLKMKVSKQAIESGVRGNAKDVFDQLLKKNDCLVYDEMQRLMAKMIPAQQDFLETIAKAMINGEKIMIVKKQTTSSL